MLLCLASRLEFKNSGLTLIDNNFTVVASGEGDRGGTSGVVRQLIALHGFSRVCLLPNGRPKYRFIGLFDNDSHGKNAVKIAHELDSSLFGIQGHVPHPTLHANPRQPRTRYRAARTFERRHTKRMER